jgi:hypothetical protein
MTLKAERLWFKVVMLAAAFVLANCLVAAAQPEIVKDDFFGGFDGRWEGTINFVAPEAYSKDHGIALPPTDIAFTIKGKSVSVYYKGGPKNVPEWKEAKPQQFQIAQLKTSAMILTIVSSRPKKNDENDKYKDWVETINFTITHKDRDGLFVAYSRSVNNYMLEYDHSGDDPGRFFNMGFGEMTRVPPQ